MAKPLGRDKVKQWILKHDDCKIFIVLYISMAVLLTLLISLFWLVLVVFIHFIFELIRQYYLNKTKIRIVLDALWETKLDIVLILFALCLDVYLDFVFGIAGIGAGARAVAQTGSRIAIWQQVIRGVIISLDDVVQVIRFTGGKKKISKSIDEAVDEDKNELPESKITTGDILSLSFGVLILGLILFAPIITKHSPSDVVNIMLEELHPWPI